MSPPLAQPTVESLVSRRTWRWWTVALRGIAAILFGVIALFSPGLALVSLVFVFGVYALVDGVLALGMGIRARRFHRRVMIARGIASILAGLVALLWPGITTFVLLAVIASWAIVAGVLEIVMAIQLRSELEHEWLMALEGALSLGFGVLLLLSPLAGAVVLGLWVGAYALVFGGMLLETGLHLRASARTHQPA